MPPHGFLVPSRFKGRTHFFLIAGEGLEKDRQIIYDALSKQLSENYFFSVVDGTRSGVYLDFHENGVWVRNEKSALNRSEMYLQIDIVDWRIKPNPLLQMASLVRNIWVSLDLR